jgi:DNA replication protein DnaC
MPAKDEPLSILLRAFNLTTMARIVPEALAQAQTQNWSHRELLLHLCESEAQERGARLTERLLKASGLPEGKTLATLHEATLPERVRRQLPALLAGDFIERNENLLAFGLPGRGKTHFLAALGRELILRHNRRVLFVPTFKLVGRLLQAKAGNKLEEALKNLDRFEVVILDDIGYVQQSREEMEVLFTFLAERYERRSLLVSSNLVTPLSSNLAAIVIGRKPPRKRSPSSPVPSRELFSALHCALAATRQPSARAPFRTEKSRHAEQKRKPIFNDLNYGSF